MTTPAMSWDDFDDLPGHDDEVMSAHGCVPSEEQHVKNGATPAPGAPYGDSAGLP